MINYKFVNTLSASMYVLGFFIILFLVILRYSMSEYVPLNWDSSILIDGSYRVFLGQKPHADFSTPLGPIIFLVGAIGMKLSTPTILGLNVGYIISGTFVLILGFAALRKILQPQLMAIFLVLLASMVFTPRMLSYSTISYGYTGIYNNFGYSVLLILVLLLFADPRLDVNSRRTFFKGVLAASIVVILWFLKITYGIASVFLMSVWLVQKRDSALTKTFFFGALFGGATFLLVIVAWLDFNLYSIVRDIKFVIYSRSEVSPFTSSDFWKLFINRTVYDNIFIVIAMSLGVFTMPEHKKKIITIGVSFLFLGFFLSASINQQPEHILSNYFAFCILIFSSTKSYINNSSSSILTLKNGILETYHAHSFSNYCKILLVAFSVIWVFKLILMNVQGVFNNRDIIYSYPSPSFNIEDSKSITEQLINPVLLKWYKPGDKILSVGSNNIYSFHFLTEPLINNLLYWQYKTTFTQDLIKSESYFSPNNIFKEVNLIYLSREFHHDSSVDAFLNAYSDYLSANFNVKENSEQLVILKHK